MDDRTIWPLHSTKILKNVVYSWKTATCSVDRVNRAAQWSVHCVPCRLYSVSSWSVIEAILVCSEGWCHTSGGGGPAQTLPFREWQYPSAGLAVDLAIPAVVDIRCPRDHDSTVVLLSGCQYVDDLLMTRILWGAHGVKMVKHLLALKLKLSGSDPLNFNVHGLWLVVMNGTCLVLRAKVWTWIVP